jgi:hypothetical protein
MLYPSSTKKEQPVSLDALLQIQKAIVEVAAGFCGDYRFSI